MSITTMTLRSLVHERARSNPSDPFCIFEDLTTTFADLDERSGRFASALYGFGVRSGDRVGLMMGNSPDHIILFFALNLLGVTVVPISVHLKLLGLKTQLSSAKPRFIIAESVFEELAEAAASEDAVEAVLWRGNDISRNGPKDRLLTHVLDVAGRPVPDRRDGVDFPCMISYTSGTTGAPKGAVLSERWFQIGAKNAGMLAQVQPGDVLFLWEPFYHIAGWMSVLMSLQHGVPLAMVERFSASRCWEQIRHYGATHFHYLGGAMNLLLKQPADERDSDNPVRIAWGAAAPTQSWRAFEERFNVTIREGYGITEAGNFTMLNIDGPVGSIGKPVEEFDAFIGDESGLPVPDGDIGEIVLRPVVEGVTMLEYFENPEKTAEVLKGGLVFTGDLGYREREGYFYFTGRKKDSLRRRGENVSAWEVERVINAHETVEESAVIGVPSEMGEEDIKAFVRPAESMSVKPADILEWCAQHLAYYQLPRFIEIVDDFPRGPTQRIRKTELPRSVEASWDGEAHRSDRLRGQAKT